MTANQEIKGAEVLRGRDSQPNIDTGELTDAGTTFAETVYSDGVNRGLPRLDMADKPVSFFEFWPTWFFYIPVVIYWVFLSVRYRSVGLPMLVNPEIHLGGMVGESKVAILNAAGEVAQPYILPCVLRENYVASSLHNRDDSFAEQAENDIAYAISKNIALPFIVKPELGCRGSGVQVIQCRDDLIAYLRAFPSDRRYIIQQLSPYVAEAGVFYERYPGQENGEVTSLTLKYRPTVVGDGVSTLRTLIVKDARASVMRDCYLQKNRARLASVPEKGEEVALSFAGSHSRGSIFRNGNSLINDGLSEKIDKIMLDFPNFHYGRLDIKFRNVEQFQRGEDFYIIEVNGVSSEKTHIWDSRTRFFSVFSTLFEQYGTLFKMGAALRDKGYAVPSIKELIKTWLTELKSSRRYPNSD